MDMEHERRLTEVEERAKSNSHRLDSIEKRQDDLEELTSTVKVLAVREENVENTVKEIKDDVKSLTSKPGKRWDNLISQIITLLVAAVFGLELELGDLGNKLLAVVNAAFAVLTILGVVNDPTTATLSDSDNAMTYSEPKAKG